LEDEAKDDEVVTLGEKNVATLKLNPQSIMEKACTCTNEEDTQKRKKKRKKKKKAKKGSDAILPPKGIE